MKTKTNVKASGPILQHNQTAAGLKVKSSVKASGPGLVLQHNQTSAALKVQSNVKAGLVPAVQKVREAAR